MWFSEGQVELPGVTDLERWMSAVSAIITSFTEDVRNTQNGLQTIWSTISVDSSFRISNVAFYKTLQMKGDF